MGAYATKGNDNLGHDNLRQTELTAAERLVEVELIIQEIECAKQALIAHIAKLRDARVAWSVIGRVQGISPQGAQQWFNRNRPSSAADEERKAQATRIQAFLDQPVTEFPADDALVREE